MLNIIPGSECRGSLQHASLPSSIRAGKRNGFPEYLFTEFPFDLNATGLITSSHGHCDKEVARSAINSFTGGEKC